MKTGMANGTEPAVGLSFPRDAFAKLLPAPFLAAHLKQPDALRPNGRRPDQFRRPTINTGSLTHADGSAVVRLGDTAIVCGIRGEILLASDVPFLPPSDGEDGGGVGLVETLGLIVPNLELSTGCSPAHLPGNPPGSRAQALSHRIASLLYDSHVLRPDDLCITYEQPTVDDDGTAAGHTTVTKGYWTLYVDIICLALDGNAFDAAWLAVVAALLDTRLAHAGWDQDREAILCSPLAAAKRSLNVALPDVPIASTFAVFSTASPFTTPDTAQSWLLADPDADEEDACGESLTLVSFPTRAEGDGGSSRLVIEKSGGPFLTAELMKQCHGAAEQRRAEVVGALRLALVAGK